MYVYFLKLIKNEEKKLKKLFSFYYFLCVSILYVIYYYFGLSHVFLINTCDFLCARICWKPNFLEN